MTTSNNTTKTMTTIEADEHVAMIHIYREFAATAAQLFRAHTEPELFLRWVGPADRAPRSTTGMLETVAPGGTHRPAAQTARPSVAASTP